MSNTKLYPFYYPWPNLGVKLSRQWDKLRDNTEKEAPLIRAAYVDPQPVTANAPGEHDLSGWAIGERDFRNKFRIWYDKNNDRFSIQYNSGTEDVEVWNDYLTVRQIDGRVTIHGYGGLDASVGGFYSPITRNLAVSATFTPPSTEWIWPHSLNTKPILWNTFNLEDKSITPQSVDVSNPNIAYFYFSQAYAGRAIAVAEVARGDGIRITDGTNNYTQSTILSFNGGQFYISHGLEGYPTINLQPNAASGLFHGSLSGLSDDDHSQYLLASQATSRAAFTANWTDLTDGGETSLHTHPAGSNDHGALTGLTDDDHPQYSLADGTRAFTGTVGGITPTADAHLVTKAYVDTRFADFYRNAISPGTVDHGALTGLGDDDHTQYSLVDGTRAFTGVVSGITPVANANLVTKAYVDTRFADFYRNVITTPVIDHGALTGLGDDDHPQYLLRTEASPGFYGLSVRETDGTPPSFRNDTLLFNSDSFYLTPDSTGKPIVNLRGVTGSGSGISSINVKESDGNPPAFAVDTLIFNSSDFYLAADSSGYPTVNLRATSLTTTSGGAYSNTYASSLEWTVNHGLGTAAVVWDAYNGRGEAVIPYKVDVSNPNIAYFYYGVATAGTAVILSSGGTSSASGVTDHGALTGLSDDDHPQYARKAASQNTFRGIITAEAFYLASGSGGEFSKQGDDILIRSSTGRVIIDDDVTITGALTASLDGGFYGVNFRETDGGPDFRNDTIYFDSGAFYLHPNSVGKPIVSFRGSAGGGGVTDHGALTGLSDDDHPQYARLAAGKNTFEGHIVAEAFYLPNGFEISGEAGYATISSPVEIDVHTDAALLMESLGNAALSTLPPAEDVQPGNITINTGNSSGSVSASAVNIIAGSATGAGGGQGAHVNINSGDSLASHAGDVNLTGGDALGSGRGGDIILTAGTSVSGAAGAVSINAGAGSFAVDAAQHVLSSGPLSMTSQKITDLAAPTDNNDAARLIDVINNAGQFYGIYIRETDSNPPTFRNDTITFDSAYFYLHGDSVGKPIISLREAPDITGVTSLSASWKFDTSTVAADPGSKNFRLNTGTLATATAIYIDDITMENFDIGTLAGFLSAGQRIYIQQIDNSERAVLFTITGVAVDGGGFWTIPVIAVADSGNLFGSNKECRFIISLSTVAGADHGALTGLADDDHPQYLLRTEASPGFYGVSFRESDGNPPAFRNDTLIFDSDYFYLQRNSVGKPIVSFRPTASSGVGVTDHGALTGLADDDHPQYLLRTEMPPGFYGIYIRESDGAPSADRDDTLIFDSAAFYLNSNSAGKPMVSLRNNPIAHSGLTGLTADDHTQYSLVAGTRAFSGTVAGVTPVAAADLATKGYVDAAVGPGFYGIYIRESDGTPSADRDDTLIFDSAAFYINSNSVGKPMVSLRNSPQAHSGLTGLTADDHTQYSLVAGTRAFTGTVGGITPVAAADLATKGYVDAAVGPGFYGIYILESDGTPPTDRDDTLIFDSQYFYLSSTSARKPTVSLRFNAPLKFVQNFTVGAREWQVNHNLGTNDLLFNVYDNRQIAIIPGKADVSNPNTAFFYFSTTRTGKAVLLGL